MAAKDYREFITKLEKVGEVVHVEREVDWDLEVGAITRRANEMGLPAPLFENIKDYPGFRILGGPVANFRRMAVALGLPAETSIKDMSNKYYARSQKRIKPVIVKKAPCQENVVMGDDVDLTMLSTPMGADGDGGRYLGTWHTVITKDLDSEWTNWGSYRQMIHNEHIMCGLIAPFQDAGKMQAKYVAKGLNMPFVTAIGDHPCSVLAAGTPLGVGEDEVELAGALIGEPVELVKAKTCDILVPARAEIIIEGEVLSPEVKVDEGPFAEAHGYRASPRMPRSVYKVNCITFRDNPIFVFSSTGVPMNDGYVTAPLHGGEWKKLLLDQGIPVKDVYVAPGGPVVVSVKKFYSNIANHVACLIWGSKNGFLHTHIIVVDEDVDPFNMSEVLHALVTKCHPLNNIHATLMVGATLGSFLSMQDRTYLRGAAVVFDCTWPLDWNPYTEVPTRCSFTGIYPKEVQEKVLANWKKYGFK